MTRMTDKWWARILLVALCAVLAAGGTFFAACFGYGRTWRAGGSRAFSDSEFARAYVADCMDYLMNYSDWAYLPSAASAEGYGGDSFGCRLLSDGAIVFDTTSDDAALLQTEVFYRYEDIPAEGSAEDYEHALWYGPYTDPDLGTVVGVYSEAPPAAEDASGESGTSGEPAARDQVFLTVEREYTLEGYLNYPIEPYSGLYAEYSFWQFMLAVENWALPLSILFFALAAALAYALARDALRRKASAKLPMDALAAGVIVLTALLSLILRSLADEILIDATGSSYILLGQLMPMTARIIRTFLWTAAGVTLLCSALRRDWKSGVDGQLLCSRLPAEVRVLFPLGIGIVFQAIGFLTYSEGVVAVGLALILVSGLFSVLLFRQLRKLRKASERLAAGDLESKVGAERYWPGVREQAAALDRIGDGIKTAVDEQLKGERLKTELITNVSHDLKTPVTSIVSCADLLKRPETTPEQAAEYVDMLERQSRKLQKLTDDLLEASKASSGAIDVQKEPTDVRELLTQSVGEFSERLEQKGIVPVLTLPEGPCVLNTDGQLLWRILDNLLSNVCKYAQPDTRAYIDLETSPDETAISLKNTSANPLNISAEALMERFVRGDSSRSTEGSGLGLSIAQSLARLLGGELDLQIDGDLFKAVLRFPTPEAEK